MTSTVNFPCKIYVFSKFSGLHNGISSDCGLIVRVTLYCCRRIILTSHWKMLPVLSGSKELWHKICDIFSKTLSPNKLKLWSEYKIPILLLDVWRRVVRCIRKCSLIIRSFDMCAYCSSFLKLTPLHLLPSSMSNATHILVQSSYVPSCFGGNHHHLQRRQRNRQQNTAIRKCLLCYAHRCLSRNAPTRAVCHTSLVSTSVVGCAVGSGGSVRGCIRLP